MIAGSYSCEDFFALGGERVFTSRLVAVGCASFLRGGEPT
jgi:hypothetical protein